MLSTKLPNPRSAGLSPLSLCARVASITAWPNGFPNQKAFVQEVTMLSTKLPNPRSAGLSPLSLCARVASITAWPNGFPNHAYVSLIEPCYFRFRNHTGIE